MEGIGRASQTTDLCSLEQLIIPLRQDHKLAALYLIWDDFDCNMME